MKSIEAYLGVHVRWEGAAPLVVSQPWHLQVVPPSGSPLGVRFRPSPPVHNGHPAVQVAFAPFSRKLYATCI